MTQLFQRACTLHVGDAVFSGLRAKFRITKTLRPEPNTVQVKVYNLSTHTRAQMKTRGVPVILAAGYVDTQAIIFRGDARTIDHIREGADWITHIQCGDGERAYKFTRFNQAFLPGTPIATVINAAANALGINLGNLPARIAQGGFRGNLTQFVNGYSGTGSAMKQLESLLRTVGLGISIQDGALQVLGNGEVVPGNAIVLSPQTGLVGSPDHASPNKVSNQSLVKAKSLLQPQLKCGGVVVIQSNAIPNGQFRVEKLEHLGDTAGQEWYSMIEAHSI